MLEQFFRDTIKLATGNECPSLYGIMDIEQMPVNTLSISTRFKGTRENPSERGCISGIGIDNFTPQAFIAGILDGIAQELYSMYQGAEPRMLIGSGNCIRKTPLLQKILSEKFGTQIYIPVHKEEASYGAALYSLVTAGKIKCITDAQKLIRYTGR
jgi:sedoheptulokinase